VKSFSFNKSKFTKYISENTLFYVIAVFPVSSDPVTEETRKLDTSFAESILYDINCTEPSAYKGFPPVIVSLLKAHRVFFIKNKG
jgi:hypothetical protein